MIVGLLLRGTRIESQTTGPQTNNLKVSRLHQREREIKFRTPNSRFTAGAMLFKAASQIKNLQRISLKVGIVQSYKWQYKKKKQCNIVTY